MTIPQGKCFSSQKKTKIPFLAQIQTKETLKKHLWSKIVVEKIRNQAKVLELASLSGDDQIMSFAKKVKLNDKDNMEAVASDTHINLLRDETPP